MVMAIAGKTTSKAALPMGNRLQARKPIATAKAMQKIIQSPASNARAFRVHPRVGPEQNPSEGEGAHHRRADKADDPRVAQWAPADQPEENGQTRGRHHGVEYPRHVNDRNGKHAALPGRRAGHACRSVEVGHIVPGERVRVGQGQAKETLEHADKRRPLGESQREQEQEHRYRRSLAGKGFAAPQPGQDIRESRHERDEPENGHQQVGRFLARKHEGQDCRGHIKVQPPAAVQVAPHQDDERKGPEHHDDVVAAKAAEIQEHRGKRQHHGCQNGALPSDVVAQEPGQRHQRRAEQRVPKAGGEVGISEYLEHDRGHLNLEGAMHPRRMHVVGAENPRPAQDRTGAVGQPPGIMQVDGLVIVHRPATELEEPKAEGGKDHCSEGQLPRAEFYAAEWRPRPQRQGGGLSSASIGGRSEGSP